MKIAFLEVIRTLFQHKKRLLPNQHLTIIIHVQEFAIVPHKISNQQTFAFIIIIKVSVFTSHYPD